MNGSNVKDLKFPFHFHGLFIVVYTFETTFLCQEKTKKKKIPFQCKYIYIRM